MDRAGARHGNLTTPRISPSCPHCLWLWLDRSIITGLPARVGQDSRGVLPQCETARHRLLCGRMGTALHLSWPSLMRNCIPHRWSWRILQRRLLFSKAPPGKYSDNRIFGFQGTSEKQFLLACIGEDVGILITLQFQFSKSFFNCLRMRTFRLWTAG